MSIADSIDPSRRTREQGPKRNSSCFLFQDTANWLMSELSETLISAVGPFVGIGVWGEKRPGPPRRGAAQTAWSTLGHGVRPISRWSVVGVRAQLRDGRGVSGRAPLPLCYLWLLVVKERIGDWRWSARDTGTFGEAAVGVCGYCLAPSGLLVFVMMIPRAAAGTPCPGLCT